jgi:hypothetical protein
MLLRMVRMSWVLGVLMPPMSTQTVGTYLADARPRHEGRVCGIMLYRLGKVWFMRRHDRCRLTRWLSTPLFVLCCGVHSWHTRYEICCRRV